MGNYKVDKKNSDSTSTDPSSLDFSSTDSSSSGSRFTNRSANELMLNSMLRDFLKRNVAPDFESRILTKLSFRRGSSSTASSTTSGKRSFSDDELDEALGAAQADVEFGQKATQIRIASKSPERPIKRLDPRWWDYKRVRAIAACVALAASVCIAYFSMPKQIWMPWKKDIADSTESLAEVAVDTPELEKESVAQVPAEPQSIDPSPLASSVASDSRPNVPDRMEDVKQEKVRWNAPSAARMSRFEIANVIDSQIDDMWGKLNVKGKEDKSIDLWLARVTQSAIGRQPTATEKESFRLNKSDDPRADYVERLIESEEFSIHWSTLLAEHYLGVPVLTKRNRSSELVQFVNWIQTSIQQNQSIVDVEVAMVSNETKASDPASYWISEQFKTDWSVESNVSSSTLVKVPYLKKDERVVNIATTLLHRTGNQWVACTQCHSSDSSEIASFSKNASGVVGNFWSFPAAIEKMNEKRKAAQEASSRPNKSREFFYEDRDGNLVLATPSVTVYIDGKEHKTSELGEWIRLSSQARSGVAEFVWTQIVQQPLVPVYGLSDTEASAERTDLKELLSKQLHISGSVQELVASLLLSKAMGVAEAKWTTQGYMNASEETLSDYHRSARLFAFAPSSRERASGISRKSVTQIAGWLQTKGNFTNPTLAQPSAVKTQNPTKKKPELDEGEKLLFLMSVDAPYANLNRFASIISKSNLSWNDQVNHTYLMTFGRYPTALERREASRLLEYAGNDSKKAIVLLATNQLGSF
jgi:hypothetical protein